MSQEQRLVEDVERFHAAGNAVAVSLAMKDLVNLRRTRALFGENDDRLPPVQPLILPSQGPDSGPAPERDPDGPPDEFQPPFGPAGKDE